MKTTDFPLGSTFEHEGVTLTVVDDSDSRCCDGCWFIDKEDCGSLNCMSTHREDGLDVQFRKAPGHEEV